ncbi:hypothetical protein SERLADRAFT_438688 [Serpula lacrymans var. lacrymans S7.9]|uniref:Uncharacterized protein n=1 Tax=Serpula lacrymans var. lacrymans (strain S7.9) TaxID=578457 RepID=F8NZP5_SERL9|nr:uncharacterized protein SERLADRAFT_438688 [Serpula lacrymans var. lacrymans S7.9]EGO23376.1 hypothetical protein SERLADRAFT_438688 [Serpula lacrymans var. lacrymans S7.9]
MDNYTTQVGEGFHQEVREAYKQTNCKNTDPQMARIDENQEAIARIQMLVDNSNLEEAQFQDHETHSSQYGSANPTNLAEDHYKFGSPTKFCNTMTLEADRGWRGFNRMARRFFAAEVAGAKVGEGPIKILPYLLR